MCLLVACLFVGAVSLGILHETITTLLRPLFGSIPLEVQLPPALQYCFVLSVALCSLLPTELPHASTMCYAMGTSLTLASLSAGRMAKLLSHAGALHGSLWAMIGLLAGPTILGALLWVRIIVSQAHSLSSGVYHQDCDQFHDWLGNSAKPHSLWNTMVLKGGLAVAFICSASKARTFVIAKFSFRFGVRLLVLK